MVNTRVCVGRAGQRRSPRRRQRSIATPAWGLALGLLVAACASSPNERGDELLVIPRDTSGGAAAIAPVTANAPSGPVNAAPRGVVITVQHPSDRVDPSRPDPIDPPEPTDLDVTIEQAEARLLGYINERRRRRGVAPLQRSPIVDAVARRHSERMLEASHLSHQFDGEPGSCDRINTAVPNNAHASEIAGMSRQLSAGRLMANMVQERSNIRGLTDADFTHVGLAIASRDGLSFVTVDLFRLE